MQALTWLPPSNFYYLNSWRNGPHNPGSRQNLAANCARILSLCGLTISSRKLVNRRARAYCRSMRPLNGIAKTVQMLLARRV